jgi:hypothetical protein
VWQRRCRVADVTPARITSFQVFVQTRYLPNNVTEVIHWTSTFGLYYRASKRVRYFCENKVHRRLNGTHPDRTHVVGTTVSRIRSETSFFRSRYTFITSGICMCSDPRKRLFRASNWREFTIAQKIPSTSVCYGI